MQSRRDDHDPAADIGEGVEVGPFVVVEGEVRVGPGCVVRAGVHLIGPLTTAVALVYKSIKCRQMREVPKEAAVILSMIVLSMVAAAVVLVVVVETMDKW